MQGSLDLTEDWSELYTADEIKSLFPTLCKVAGPNPKENPLKDLSFPGEGKYLTKAASYLIAHTSAKKEGNDLFRIICWQRPSVGSAPDNPMDIFNQVANATTHLDAR